MLKNYGFKVDDKIKLKDNNYGCGKIKEFLPLGTDGKRYQLAKVY